MASSTVSKFIKCKRCCAPGIMILNELDYPYAPRDDNYSFEGRFSGGGHNPPLSWNNNDDTAFWQALGIRCNDCGSTDAPLELTGYSRGPTHHGMARRSNVDAHSTSKGSIRRSLE
jgi:hypothetical protein